MYSNGRWKTEAGHSYRNKVEARWNASQPQTYDIICEIPSTHCHSWNQFEEHLRYTLLHQRTIIGFYLPMKWRQLNWKTSIKRQKAYDRIVLLLTGAPNFKRKHQNRIRETIVAYGGGQFSSTSPGYAPTPVKGLFERLKKSCFVRKVPEYRTTKTCSGCDRQLEEADHPRILRCNNNCKIIWNRDINAAINLRRVWLHLNANAGRRPEPFLPPNRED